MYEFHPYFTKDGSVGLYSPVDDDIYHSSYGALSEAYEKFILPAQLEQFCKNNSKIRILDICYGIGYNTKAFLNTFVNSQEKKKGRNNFFNPFSRFHTPDIAAIDTDNISEEKKNKTIQNNFKNLLTYSNSSAPIDTDNISEDVRMKFNSKFPNFSNLINSFFKDVLIKKLNSKQSTATLNSEITIDVIDTDDTLIALSPLIAIQKPRRVLNSKIINENFKIKKILQSKSKTIKSYKLKKEVSVILYKKLLENNSSFLISKNFIEILSNNQNLSFFDEFMLNLVKYGQKSPYKYSKAYKISAFLHNIYYRYLSTSYKRAEKLLQNHQIDVRPHIKDARIAIKELDMTYDFIFLDAFTPAKCPCLWSLDFFKELYKRLDTDGLILTYSNSVIVKSAFLQAGFFVGKIKSNTSGKFTGTIATKNKDLIKTPLTDYDLGLINSKAGICYKDASLNLDNDIIIQNRAQEFDISDLISSSQFIKEYNNAKL